MGGSSNDSRLDYIVAIHEDVDHVGGLRDEGATIYQTDLNGTVVFYSDRAHMTVKCK